MFKVMYLENLRNRYFRLLERCSVALAILFLFFISCLFIFCCACTVLVCACDYYQVNFMKLTIHMIDVIFQITLCHLKMSDKREFITANVMDQFL